VQGVWTRRNIPDRDIVRSSFRLGGRVNLTSSLRANVETSYDWSLGILRHLRAGFEYNVQCCGFLLDFNRYNFGDFRNENTFRFGITLANIGSFGTSLGGTNTDYY
jgi:hypothetical protein